MELENIQEIANLLKYDAYSDVCENIDEAKKLVAEKSLILGQGVIIPFYYHPDLLPEEKEVRILFAVGGLNGQIHYFSNVLDSDSDVSNAMVYLDDVKAMASVMDAFGYVTDKINALEGRKDGNHEGNPTGDPVRDDDKSGGELRKALDSKVDKVAGKGLSTNDFTNELKKRLETIGAGGMSRDEVVDAIDAACRKIVDEMYDRYQPKGKYLTSHQSLDGYAKKSDLSSFVTDASLSAVSKSGSYNDLKDTPRIPDAYDDSGIRSRITALERSGASGGTSYLTVSYTADDLTRDASKGCYYNLSDGVGSSAPLGVTIPGMADGLGCMRIPVSRGSVYVLSTNGSGNGRAYALTDVSMVMYQVADPNARLRDFTINVTKDGWLYVNCQSAGYSDFALSTTIQSKVISEKLGSPSSAGSGSLGAYRNGPLPRNVDNLKVLYLGNSFAVDATSEISNIIEHSGIDAGKIVISAYTPSGGQFSDYIKVAEDGSTMSAARRAGTLSVTGKGTWSQIVGQDWDVIVLCQYSRIATDWDAFKCLPTLLAHIRRTCTNQNVCIAYQSPWGHTPGDAESVLSGSVEIARKLADVYGIDVIVPCGMALQNVRGTSLNNAGYLTRDDWHLALGVGQYTAACALFQSIIGPAFNKSILGNTATRILTAGELQNQGAESVTEANRGICQEAAFMACINMFEVSEIEDGSHNETPVDPVEPEPDNPTPVELSGISINLSDTLTEAAQATVTYSPNDVDSSYKGVTWSIVSGSEYATIDGNGLVTPVASGSVVIKATSTHNSGISATKTVAISVGSQEQGGGSEEPETGEIALSSLNATWINTNWGENYSAINTSTVISADTCLATFPKIPTISDCILVARDGYQVQALKSNNADTYNGTGQTGWKSEIDLSTLTGSTYQCLGVHSADNSTHLIADSIDSYAYLQRKQ